MSACKTQCCSSTKPISCKLSLSQLKYIARQHVMKVCDPLKPYGIHSSNRMRTAGFQYTGKGDTARCKTCNLEVSGWNQYMDPFCIHRERSPNCSFIQSMLGKNMIMRKHTENEVKPQKIELNFSLWSEQSISVETSIVKDVRRRTFSHWSIETAPTREQMVLAGFFYCNVGDRVMCLYCNLICQNWEIDIDDPVEVHKILSSNCPFVLSVLTQVGSTSIAIVNANSVIDQNMYTLPCHIAYSNSSSRQATFATWNNPSTPPVEELVQAGFFYTGTENILTCFQCNGSLQNLRDNDNPLVEHLRWFSNCSYAKQLVSIEVYNKIQEAKRIRQEHEASAVFTNTTQDTPVLNGLLLDTTDERLVARLVAARLDLPISQRLMDQNFRLSVIKRCWENQLRLKQDDFVTDCDLFIACVILSKQIEYINGDSNNITVPSVKMKQIRDQQESGILDEEQMGSPLTTTHSNDKPTTAKTVSETNLVVDHPCVLCGKEEKRLACIPCGHLATCIICSQTLRTCPICQRQVEAFVRIYL